MERIGGRMAHGHLMNFMDLLVMTKMVSGVRIARRATPKIRAVRFSTDGSVPPTGGPGKRTKSRKT